MPVSVVTPNFNNGPYVHDYLASLVDDPAVSEIVVYDNSSSDGSADVLERLGAPKIRVIRGDQNLGASGGRHRAVEAARCDYICILDGDDFLEAGAVSSAFDTARRENLDVVAFQLYDVKPDGTGAELSIAVPDKVITGREACALTLGGWRIHPLGLVRRSVYLAAWKGFQQHGYSDDELLTRRIFLAADRVAGSSGKYFYRRLPKPINIDREVGTLKTALSVLALAKQNDLPEKALRAQRNMVTRSLVGMVRRRVLGRINSAELCGLLRRLDAIDVPWRLTDWRYTLMAAALRVIHR
jgi:glycosyltransferase involved in cell wall biosynthesis